MKLTKYYAFLISFIIAVVILACTGIGIAIGHNNIRSMYTEPRHGLRGDNALSLESAFFSTVMPTAATTKKPAAIMTTEELATITTTERLATKPTSEELATIATTERPATITSREELVTTESTDELATTERPATIMTTEELATAEFTLKPATHRIVNSTISSIVTEAIASKFKIEKIKNNRTSTPNLPKIVLNINSCKLFRNKAETILAKNGKSIPNYPDIGDSGQNYSELQSICENRGEFEFIELIKKEICMLLNNMSTLKAAAEACALKRINNQEMLEEELIQIYICSQLLVHRGNFQYDIPFQFLVDKHWKGVLYILLVASRANAGAVDRCVKPELQRGFIFNNTHYESNAHGFSLAGPINILYKKYFEKNRQTRINRSIKYADVIMKELVENGIHEFSHDNSGDKKAFRTSNKNDLKVNHLSYQQSSMFEALTLASDIAKRKAKNLG